MSTKRHAPVICDHAWEDVRAANKKLYGWHCARCKCHRNLKKCPCCGTLFGQNAGLDDPFCSDKCRGRWKVAHPKEKKDPHPTLPTIEERP